jgi:large subunit ribosomal protein L10e
MRNAFGKAVSVEALCEKDQKVLTIDINPKNFLDAKLALKRASQKLPVSCKIVVDKGADLIK